MPYGALGGLFKDALGGGMSNDATDIVFRDASDLTDLGKGCGCPDGE